MAENEDNYMGMPAEKLPVEEPAEANAEDWDKVDAAYQKAAQMVQSGEATVPDALTGLIATLQEMVGTYESGGGENPMGGMTTGRGMTLEE